MCRRSGRRAGETPAAMQASSGSTGYRTAGGSGYRVILTYYVQVQVSQSIVEG